LIAQAKVSVPKTPSIGFAIAGESEHDCWMFAIAFLFVRVLCDCFKSRPLLEAPSGFAPKKSMTKSQLKHL
jgi:hypothetical protein